MDTSGRVEALAKALSLGARGISQSVRKVRPP